MRRSLWLACAVAGMLLVGAGAGPAHAAETGGVGFHGRLITDTGIGTPILNGPRSFGWAMNSTPPFCQGGYGAVGGNPGAGECQVSLVGNGSAPIVGGGNGGYCEASSGTVSGTILIKPTNETYNLAGIYHSDGFWWSLAGTISKGSQQGTFVGGFSIVAAVTQGPGNSCTNGTAHEFIVTGSISWAMAP